MSRYAEIEERLSAKKDMLDEKELVLSETSQLIEVHPTPNISTAFLYRLTHVRYYDGHEETWLDNVVMKEGDHKADALLRFD